MKRKHALIISLVLALAVVFGASAAIRSTQLSTAAQASQVSAAQPALPSAAGKPRIVYERPPAIVHVVHRHGEEGGFDD